MNVVLAFSVVWLAIQLDNTLALHKCSPEVIKKIEALWAKEGKPKDLIQQAVAAGKQNVIKTSKDYYPEGTTCSYTLFSQDGKFVKLITVVNGKAQHDMEESIEKDGVVVEKDTGIKRYHVYSKNGVAAWYKCGDRKYDEGQIPDGAIKVPNAFDYNEEDVNAAKRRLESIGIALTDDYDSNC